MAKYIKISKGLSNSKNMVFNMKKLLNVGVGLMLRQRGKKKQYGQNEWQILQILAASDWFSPANVSTPTSTNSFLDSMYSLGPEVVS